MPRRPRISTGGYAYHVLNRAVGRCRIFRKDEDYAAMERVLAEVHRRLPVPILSYCLMPNHWHFVLWPQRDGELSEFMRLLTVTHTQRWHAHHHSAGTGPLYQGRFKSFPIQRDHHLLVACRYVERNAAAAKLAERAEDWPWGSAQARQRKGRPAWLATESGWPVPRPGNWLRLLNEPPPSNESERIELSVQRSCPLGEDEWVRRTAKAMSLESTLRPRGRPRKREDDE
jgi:putative transposase